jgi:hypothetical protein
MEEMPVEGGWAQASLRIASEDESAEAISELLGRRPSTTRASEGEPVFTVWVLESGLDPSAPIEDHLYILVEGLRDHREPLAELAARANVEVWLSYSPGRSGHRSAIFDSQILGELGEVGIDLVRDHYPPGGKRSGGDA